VQAQDVEVVRHALQEQLLRELLHRQHVGDERVAPQALHGERVDGRLGGQDAGAEDDDVRVHLAEVIGVAVVPDVQRGCDLAIIRTGCGDDVVAVLDEPLREELAEVPEAHDADLQRALLLNLLPLLRLEVERLRRVQRAGGHGRGTARAEARL
jgi:hypothetical protein